MILYCCGCQQEVHARIVRGSEIYPRRRDLFDIPFWKCDVCGNYVGCHHKTKDPTRPLGPIPTPELREVRRRIHGLLDPIWESGAMKRSAVYAELSRRLGRQYHSAEIRSIEEATQVLYLVDALRSESGMHVKQIT